MSTNKKTNLLKLCFAAMFAALVCVGTVLIVIPTPFGGYVNFGDCFILVAAWTLGPYYGFAAGGIGSMLADLFTGYAMYAPATFIIKGLIGLVAGLIMFAFKRKNHRFAGYVTGAVAGELLMAVGYFLFEAIFILGVQGAWINMPYNLVQAAAGAVIGCALMCILEKTVLKRQLLITKQ